MNNQIIWILIRKTSTFQEQFLILSDIVNSMTTNKYGMWAKSLAFASMDINEETIARFAQPLFLNKIESRISII